MKKILYSTTFTIQTSRKEALSILQNGYDALQILIITIIMTIVSLHFYSKSWTIHDISASGSYFQKFIAITWWNHNWDLQSFLPSKWFSFTNRTSFCHERYRFSHYADDSICHISSLKLIIIFFFHISSCPDRGWVWEGEVLGGCQRARHGKLDEVRAQRPQAWESEHGTSAGGWKGEREIDR